MQWLNDFYPFTGIVTQSARPFKMSTAHLVLPKLDLIGRPTQFHSELANRSSQKEQLKETWNSKLNEKELEVCCTIPVIMTEQTWYLILYIQ